MLINPKIYQVYYNDAQLPALEKDFIPYNATANTQPKLREWPHFQSIYQQSLVNGDPAWGVTSWKFKQKSVVSGTKFIDFIKANPGFDVYFINPSFILESLYYSVWEHGESYHPGIIDLASKILSYTKYSDVDIRQQSMSKHEFAFCSYIYGNRKFWDEYVDLIRSIITIGNSSAEFHKVMFEISAGYSYDQTVGFFPFVVERMFSTILRNRTDIKAIAYEYSVEDLLPKISSDAFNELRSISMVKEKASEYGDKNLLEAWHVQRSLFGHRFPNIIGLE